MKLILLILLLAGPSSACEGLINRAIMLTGLGAVALESTSAVAAYFSRSDTSEESQKKLYLAQAGTLGVSAVALTVGLLMSKGQLSSKLSTVILLDAVVGAGLGYWAYQKNALQTGTTKTAFSTAVFGLGAHLGNVALLIFKAALCCGQQRPEDYQEAV